MFMFPNLALANVSLPPSDGEVFTTPAFCKKSNIQKTCGKFYKSLSDKKGFFICPYGFSVYVIDINHNAVAFSGLKVIDRFDKRLVHPKDPLNALPLVSEETLLKLTEFNKTHLELRSHSQLTTQQLAEVGSTFHEIRKLNRDIRSQAEEMNIYLDRPAPLDTPFLSYRAQNIYGTSSLMSIRLDTYDLLVNPLGISASSPIQIPVYRKFEKVKHCLNTKCKQKKILITFYGNSNAEIPASNRPGRSCRACLVN